MDFHFTEEQAAVRDLAPQIIGDRSDTRARSASSNRPAAPRFDRELWASLAEAGILGISVARIRWWRGARSRGGGVRRSAPPARTAAAVPVWETLGLGAPAIAEFAPAEVGERLARSCRVGRGDPHRCLARDARRPTRSAGVRHRVGRFLDGLGYQGLRARRR